MNEVRVEVDNNLSEIQTQQQLLTPPGSWSLACLPLCTNTLDEAGIPIWIALSPVLSAVDTLNACMYVATSTESTWSKAAKLSCIAATIGGALVVTHQMLGPSIVDFAVAEGMGKGTGESLRTVATVLSGCYSASLSSAVMKCLSFRQAKKNYALNQPLLPVVTAPEYSSQNPAEHSPRVVHLGM